MPTNDKYSAEERALLTAEELEGLAEYEAGDEAEGLEDDDGGADDDDVKAGDEANDAANADDAGHDEGDEADDASKPNQQAIIAYQTPPEDVDTQLAAIKEQKAALADKFDDGEITARELFAQQAELDSKAQDLREATQRAAIARDIHVEAWKNNVGQFLKAHPEIGKAGSPVYQQLDQLVLVRQQKAINAGENPFNPSFLAESMEELRVIAAAFSGKPAKAADPAPSAKAEPKQAEVPPTLARIPAADITSTLDGEEGMFERLNRLADQDWNKFELALSKMTPEQRARYEQSV